jgi:ribulose-phosphate 3-epimerase
MKISASLFSRQSEYRDYLDTLQRLGISNFHVDILDSPAEKLKIVERLASDESIRGAVFDVHIVSGEIDSEILSLLNRTRVDYLCLQFEENNYLANRIALSKFNGYKGLGIVMDTPVSAIEPYLNEIDFIMIMCTVPGVSNAAFDERNVERIANLRTQYPGLPIHVDGGINPERLKLMQSAGVSLCVCGSFLAKASGRELAERSFALMRRPSQFRADRVMILRKNLALISENTVLPDILLSISYNKIGMTVVENESGFFVGVITDGDIRRALVAQGAEALKLTARNLVNRDAYTVNSSSILPDILLERQLRSKTFITAIPVLKDDRVIGILNLNEYL